MVAILKHVYVLRSEIHIVDSTDEHQVQTQESKSLCEIITICLQAFLNKYVHMDEHGYALRKIPHRAVGDIYFRCKSLFQYPSRLLIGKEKEIPAFPKTSDKVTITEQSQPFLPIG